MRVLQVEQNDVGDQSAPLAFVIYVKNIVMDAIFYPKGICTIEIWARCWVCVAPHSMRFFPVSRTRSKSLVAAWLFLLHGFMGSSLKKANTLHYVSVRTDMRHVTPCDECFGVKIGPMRTIEF